MSASVPGQQHPDRLRSIAAGTAPGPGPDDDDLWDPRPTPSVDPEVAALHAALAARDVRPLFAPLADLRSGQVVGFEALTQGPEGSPVADVQVLLATAGAQGLGEELDWVRRACAFSAMLDAGLPPGLSLFVDVEAPSSPDDCPADLIRTVSRAEASLRVFVQINDRALVHHPAALLDTVARAREMGWGVCLDDAAQNLGCLSVLSVLQPDVIKVGVGLVRDTDGTGASPVVSTMLRHIELTGAAMVVTGVHTEADSRLARALGATHSQGGQVGPPAPLAATYPAPHRAIPLVPARPSVVTASSPREIVADTPPRRMARALLDQVTALFVERSFSAGTRPLVLVACGDRAGTGPNGPASRLQDLAERSPLVVSFAPDAPEEPVPGVRGVALGPGDPLCDQEVLVVLADHLAVAVVATAPPSGSDHVDVVITQSPAIVTEVAEHLLRRVPAKGSRNLAHDAPVPRPVTEDDAGPVGAAVRRRSRWPWRW